jgi:hypothetical protein
MDLVRGKETSTGAAISGTLVRGRSRDVYVLGVRALLGAPVDRRHELCFRTGVGAAARESIQDVFEIYTVIFVAIAVFVLLRLRVELGRSSHREPPLQRTSEPSDRYGGLATSGTTVAKGLDAIMAADKDFNVIYFVAGAEAAYEMIVTAYTEGDRRKLANLLVREVYDGFAGEILGREARGEKVETRFVSIDAAEILAAELRGKRAQITVRFVSDLLTVTRDRGGNIIDGSVDNAASVTDVWTFTRTVTSRDPNWKVVATKNGA